RKFVGQKRFSLEGSESTIPFMDTVLNCAAESGLNSVVIGMSHRGRLNVLANSVGKSVTKIFGEFEGEIDPESSQGSGDVKYHLGARGTYNSEGGRATTVVLAPNPSHLEAVNPVVEGMARAIDDEISDRTYTQSLPVLLHGDAAFAGQGVVPETLNMSKLAGYRTGGTIHLIINNQIGFTTVPADSRSTTYATDIAKFLQAPILHVNGDDPEAVCRAAEFAFEWRATFQEDVVVDMYSYRKYGHNEADEPTFTQPLLYKKIKSHLPVQARYRQQLIDEKIFTAEEGEKIYQDENQRLNDAFSSRTKSSKPGAALPARKVNNMFTPVETAVSKEELLKIATAITTIPEGFHIHPKLLDLMQKRAQMVNTSLDWAMGEQLAFGTILANGRPIRFTGQDVRRGTFSHRHAVFTDIENERELIPLNHIQEGQAMLKIHDSPLSEEAVLGYEYGYSVTDKKGITFWEAQFGDFMNGAQIQIDQFITSGEVKWGQTTNLTMLLPHGFEGQGPEHSSARLERFLNACAEDNMFVCNLTTAAQYFHALRRQVLRDFKKPMIIVTPKSLLRDMKAGSTIDEFASGNFQEIIDDTSVKNPENVQRILICSGKVYYDLIAKRTELGAEDVAIIRLEQIYPFHAERMKSILEKYSRSKEVIWVQEEPKNMGAWTFVASRIWPLLQVNQRIAYIGRNESASPATGSSKKHAEEQETIKRNAFGTLA
ncbi:MAG: multifunctional oxoglutarate decarboxylase/oxoglutarate dehydrogenase thiamine pyrophosphate-binding subunit/dihydrolipoyllysine-residue succinyltransferase subunit, partial [Bacteroidota bacterium]